MILAMRVFQHYSKGFPQNPHAQRDNAEAKFWLSPVRLAWNRGFSGAELGRIERITAEHELQLVEIWNDYFGLGQ
jgi:hypothetical protein